MFEKGRRRMAVQRRVSAGRGINLGRAKLVTPKSPDCTSNGAIQLVS